MYTFMQHFLLFSSGMRVGVVGWGWVGEKGGGGEINKKRADVTACVFWIHALVSAFLHSTFIINERHAFKKCCVLITHYKKLKPLPVFPTHYHVHQLLSSQRCYNVHRKLNINNIKCCSTQKLWFVHQLVMKSKLLWFSANLKFPIFIEMRSITSSKKYTALWFTSDQSLQSSHTNEKGFSKNCVSPQPYTNITWHGSTKRYRQKKYHSMQVSCFCVHTASSQQLNVNENGQYQEQKLTSRLKKKSSVNVYQTPERDFVFPRTVCENISHRRSQQSMVEQQTCWVFMIPSLAVKFWMAG